LLQLFELREKTINSTAAIQNIMKHPLLFFLLLLLLMMIMMLIKEKEDQ